MGVVFVEQSHWYEELTVSSSNPSRTDEGFSGELSSFEESTPQRDIDLGLLF